MRKVTLSLIAIISIITSQAQSSHSTSQTVTLNLSNAIEISVSGTPSGTNFDFTTVADYTNGLTNTSASSFQVKSNKAWAVTVAAATANFSGGAVATPMPSNKLSVKLNGGGSFNALSTTAASLTTGAKGTNTFTVDYKANPGFDYEAGQYTLNVVYTATQQ